MTPNSDNLQELLAWYVDAGIDCALMDGPVNRFVQEAEEAEARKKPATRPVLPKQGDGRTAPQRATAGQRLAAPQTIRAEPPGMAVPDGKAVARAQELAAGAATLDELRKAIEGFDGCNLKFTARSTVFCDGNPDARLMLVGEAPDRHEDESGLPFVGQSGQLLDKMLAAIGLDRTSVYVSNILPWRPPGNRTPSPAETDICRPFIERHIELAKPELLMLIGTSSSQTLLGTKNNIMSTRGKWASVQIGEMSIPAMPTLHPNYLLRTPTHKRLAWNDLLAVSRKLGEFQTDSQ